MPKPNIQCIIFDLGGVLIELTGVPRMLEWLGWDTGTRSEKALWNRWLTSPTVRKFETGRSTSDEFARSMVSEFNLGIEPSQFLSEFEKWPKGWYPGAFEIIEILKKDYTLASLSNSNGLHWPRVVNEFKIEQLFHFNFPSHETGYLKPDPETYEHVVRTVGIDLEKFIFFDDNAMNIDSAGKFGMKAYCVDGFNELRRRLFELELL